MVRKGDYLRKEIGLVGMGILKVKLSLVNKNSFITTQQINRTAEIHQVDKQSVKKSSIRHKVFNR